VSNTSITKAPRPFGFSVEISDGTLWIDWCGAAVLSFRPRWFLTIGSLNITSGREEDRLQQMWTKVGLEVGRREAEEEGQRALEACEERFTKWPGTGFPPASATADEEQAS
jgi:hypothetical protein